MRDELAAFRADPTSRNLLRLNSIATPWLRGRASQVISRYRRLTTVNDGDDLVNEGLLNLTRAARRYVALCPTCRRAFLRLDSLFGHLRDEHRVLGVSTNFVTLQRFCQESARLAMKRAARRLVTVDFVDSELAETGIDDEFSRRIEFECMVETARQRLSDRAEEVLAQILTSDRVVKPRGEIRRELRRHFRDLSNGDTHPG